MRSLAIAFIGGLGLVTTAMAGVVHLKSGKAIAGQIVQQTDTSVRIMVQGVKITFYHDEIDRVELDDGQEGGRGFLSPDEEVDPEARTMIAAYRNYIDSIPHIQSIDDLANLITDARLQEIRTQADTRIKFAMILQMIKALIPQDIRMVRWNLEGETGYIIAEGADTFFNEGVMRGKISMVKEGGLWQVDQETWKSAAGAEAAFEEKKALNIEISADSVQGTIKGHAFAAEEVFFKRSMNLLTLRQGGDFFPDLALKVFIFLEKDETVDNRTFEFRPGDTILKPHIHLQWKAEGQDHPKTDIVAEDYLMQLTFFEEEGAQLPGEIHLQLADRFDTRISGKFTAVVE